MWVDVNSLNATAVIRMYTKTIGHGSASDQCYYQSAHTNQNKKSVETISVLFPMQDAASFLTMK